MRHFPIFLDATGQKVVVAGGGETAVAKLRLLLKTEFRIVVVNPAPNDQILDWAAQGKLRLDARELAHEDVICARMVYAATDDAARDAEIAKMGRGAGALVNIVDNLGASDFITPAIVDRDPVTVAIGTEGTAPVLARAIKADVENMLPSSLGLLARIGAGFRATASKLPGSRVRRNFWARYFFKDGPAALAGGEKAVSARLDALFEEVAAQAAEPGRVAFVGAGPGDPELLTRRAHKLLHEADVVIHDRLVSPEILELARREALVIEVGKTGFGPSWVQDDINAETIAHALKGHHVVRLKGGDPVVFGRLDEEIAAVEAAGVAFDVVPGITAASAAAASMGVSLTSRGRNSGYQMLTAHDLNGFAEADWRGLAKPGTVGAIYMGKKAAAFVAGRLLMFGADPDTPVTAVENASRTDARRFETRVADLGSALNDASGPVVILLGIAARNAVSVAQETEKVVAL